MTIDDSQKQIAFRSAVFSGDLEFVKSMVAAGININARDEEGYTLLVEACQEQPDPEAVKTLLAAGADPEVGDKEERLTPLMWAVKSASCELCYDRALAVLAMLIAAGVDANAGSESGATALTYAVCKDQPEVVGLLLAAGADPNARSNAGWSALDYAQEYGPVSRETSELLVKAGGVMTRKV